MVQSVSDHKFLKSAAGPLSLGALIWALASTLSTVTGSNFADAMTEPVVNRNMRVFNQMSDVQHLNSVSRALRWEDRQAAITRDIGMNGEEGFDWVPFYGKNYALGLLGLAEENRIAMVPAATPGHTTTLVVGERHGCLVVDFSKKDADLANEARRLLQDFANRSAFEYDYRGVYEIAGERTTYKAPQGAVKTVKAEDYCPLM